jgi:hypothetical protein
MKKNLLSELDQAGTLLACVLIHDFHGFPQSIQTIAWMAP